ncbi:hypothetical protein [Streptomyces sp. NBC_00503]|uniref:hypothetical protein n=1 Tax=Streptomyces sp. NBC_00503 TaxID=2903659 RepID=UPI002E8028C8|nr:hypothetical protein [Streptomyces sp. NBC_00503]WUD79361.1 hypothetical protein OG490_01555 [Streptomyces sp. NBC_00503]
MTDPTPLEAARAAAATAAHPEPGSWAAHLHAALAEVDRLTELLGRQAPPVAPEPEAEAEAEPAPTGIELRRAELDAGFTDVEWAVGMALCPAREQCTSGRLDQLFKPMEDGRLPAHWDELSGAACSGSGRVPTTPLLRLRPKPSPDSAGR